jgi:DcuC family C4-dicarboxylate transporter
MPHEETTNNRIIDNIRKLKSLLIMLYIILCIYHSFYEQYNVLYILTIVFFLVFFLDIFFINNLNRYLSIILLIVGSLLLGININNFDGWVKAFTENCGIISLMLSTPLLNMIFQHYKFSVNNAWLSRIYSQSERLFNVVVMLTYSIFGTALNIACIPLLYDIFKFEINQKNKNLYRSIIRGFSINLLWSPSFVSVAVALKYTNLSWYMIAPYGIILAIIAIIVQISFEFWNNSYSGQNTRKKKNTNIINELRSKNRNGPMNIYKILIALIIVILIVAIFEQVLQKSVMVIIPTISLSLPLVLSILNKDISVLNIYGTFAKRNMTRYNDQMILLTSIGFFGYALSHSSIIMKLNALIGTFNYNYKIITIMFFISMIGGLSIIGIHPIISISTISAMYETNKFGLSIIQLSMIFLSGYFLYSIASPFSSCILVVSGVTNETPIRLSIKANFIYSIVYILISTLFILII